MRNLFAFLRAAGALLAVAALSIAGPAQAQMAQNINAQTGTSYTFLNTDCSKLVTFGNASAVAVTLPQASSPSGGGAGAGTFMPPCLISASSVGAGLVTITPTTSTIGGASSITLSKGQSVDIISDGVNYQLKAGGSGTTAFAANGSVATVLGSLGPVGSHTTVQEWFTVTDAAGNVRYLPGF